MTKKIFIILLLSIIIASCGKKGCPKVNEEVKCKEVFKKR
tara:strand:- start:335 stop:454 length:120 start_codon:yes stop_codon:yes gene_type:complete